MRAPRIMRKIPAQESHASCQPGAVSPAGNAVEDAVLIVGIDPGADTGVAVFEDGVLSRLITIEPMHIGRLLDGHDPERVIFEDSRLQSHVWVKAKTRAAAVKIGRNIGEVDAWCKLIVAECAERGIPAHGISPKVKGKKLNAEQFEAVTGWKGASNEHTRDAAMCAWPYRSAA